MQREPSLAWPELPTPLEDVQHTKPFKTSSPRVLVPSLLAVGTFVQNIGVLEVASALAGMGPTTLSIGLTLLLVTASL